MKLTELETTTGFRVTFNGVKLKEVKSVVTEHAANDKVQVTLTVYGNVSIDADLRSIRIATPIEK